MAEIAVTFVGGPTALIEYGGLRLLTDPTFDVATPEEPKVYPDPDGGQALVKTQGPALEPRELGEVDLVLLSHHHHEDNLDLLGRDYLKTVPLTLTTPGGAKALGGTAIGLAAGEIKTVGGVTFTSTPALHGPAELDPILGPVTGFLLESPGWPRAWFSGDNSSLEIAENLAREHGSVPLLIVNAGAARVAEIDADLTFGSNASVEAARILGAKKVIGLHTEDWEHFSQNRASLEAAFTRAGLADRLVESPRGSRVSFQMDAS